MDPVVINVDIDTTGLDATKDEICRMHAFDNDQGPLSKSFSIYLMPNVEFTPEASRLNKFKKMGSSLLYNGEEVPCKTQIEGLKFFKNFILKVKGERKAVIISYNAKEFLAKFVVHGFSKYLKLPAEELDDLKIEFADPYLMLEPSRLELRGCKNLRLRTIYKHLFGEGHNDPDAERDSIALHQVLKKLEIGRDQIIKNSFAAEY